MLSTGVWSTAWRNKPSDEAAAGAAASSCVETPTELPFQLQVTYTDLDGARAMRVLTQAQRVTRDRAEAEARTYRHGLYSCYSF